MSIKSLQTDYILKLVLLLKHHFNQNQVTHKCEPVFYRCLSKDIANETWFQFCVPIKAGRITIELLCLALAYTYEIVWKVYVSMYISIQNHIINHPDLTRVFVR